MSYWSKKLYVPETGAWIILRTADVDARVSYLQILNLSLGDAPRVAVGVTTADDAAISDPTGLAGTEVGTEGTTKYEYTVTAVKADGRETNGAAKIAYTNGPNTLDANNYHSLAWTAVTGAAKYRVYCRKNDREIFMAEVLTNEYTNNGGMGIANRWPWVNMTGISALLAWTTLAPGVGLDVLPRPIQLPAGDIIKLYTTGPITAFACGEV